MKLLASDEKQDKNEGFRTGIQSAPLDEDNDNSSNELEEMHVPDDICGQFWLCIKLSVGPIVSMIFYMIV